MRIILGCTALVILLLACTAPFASAQYAGIGGGNQTLGGVLKLARDKALIYDNPASTPANPFPDPLLAVIPIAIACDGISILVFLKSRGAQSRGRG